MAKSIAPWRATEMISIQIQCETTSEVVVVPIREVTWTCSAGECEVCDWHESVTCKLTCPSCGEPHEITVLDT